jgi:hypothetical protein
MRLFIVFLCLHAVNLSSQHPCFASTIKEENTLGYISQSTLNIGDDIQTIAVKRFLPNSAVPIDREFIAEFSYNSPVKAVLSGWFMHLKGGYWELRAPPPEKSWPPSPVIDPFFVSIHFNPQLHEALFSEQNIEYLKKYSPIGARDLYTLELLQKKGIPSYFSGCLTLTLENTHTERNDIIYLVDLDEETIHYIQSKVSSPIVVMTHGKPLLPFLSTEHRLKYAEYILDLYRKAKCVVTTRLHAAMPCLAFKTPVLMFDSVDGGVEVRFTGLVEHTWHCSRRQLRDGEVEYDFDNPPENPNTYIPIRENLIKIMTDWVQENSKS